MQVQNCMPNNVDTLRSPIIADNYFIEATYTASGINSYCPKNHSSGNLCKGPELLLESTFYLKLSLVLYGWNTLNLKDGWMDGQTDRQVDK